MSATEAAVWRRVIGHERAVRRLQAQVRERTLSHALLIDGAPQVGKTTLARALVAALLCEQGGGCGGCRSCRAVERGQHPDVIEVIPRLDVKECTPAGATIHIWQIAHRPDAKCKLRTLREEAQQRPYWGRRKCFLIEPADALQHDAANALLKTIEEPPPASLLILVTPRPERLPETVRSRCQRIALDLVPAPVVQAGLIADGIEPTLAAQAAAQCGGRPGFALRLARSPELAAAREFVRSVMAELHTADLIAALKLAGDLRLATLQLAAVDADPGEPPAPEAEGRRRSEESETAVLRRAFPAAATLVAEWLREVAMAAHGVPSPGVTDAEAAVQRAQARSAVSGGLVQALRAVERSVGFIEDNAAPELVYEALTLQLLGAWQRRTGRHATRSGAVSS